eukprot:CAMPEP_0173381712 /NCGR_PEP_ID=MMETSP1356-20130122/4129_1 /TAXON_ID=77927 ORGANISM="Hemiselmis virescens, Strain PCC157" /NCGR_SAMPLE_ID=MMETSP1356 /ASSEMBLY_ACC=CAM_ASM_000847 /LENGTH=85 /DNA_ID=CAMNT_0014335673 /DNA_START=22 /DNA_END=279 /DNA_ORIENTATION=-
MDYVPDSLSFGTGASGPGGSFFGQQAVGTWAFEGREDRPCHSGVPGQLRVSGQLRPTPPQHHLRVLPGRPVVALLFPPHTCIHKV